MTRNGLPRRRQIDELISEGCRLVASAKGVRGVHIVAQRRPTYDELVRYRRAAQESHAGLTISGRGVISIRPGSS